jgi:4-diphosphocytidyl-2-C-methyl-D-erythritol kinase
MADALTAAWSEWPAPAKLNLFLHLTGRRDDGFHLLQTVFQLLDWGDSVRLRIRDDDEIVRCNPLPGVSPESDLCVRAARLLQHRLGKKHGTDIALTKRVPMGGGLGGGSSDAATVLVALNTLWQGGLDDAELARLGLQLGADVPVFVRGNSAWAEGVGEELTPLELPESWYVLVDPKVSVPTGPLFQASELTRNTAPTTISRFLSGVHTSNAFEPVVRARYESVAQALDWLNRFGAARLSGSGGCGFLAVATAAAASDIAAQCPERFAAHAVRGVNRSPLHECRDRF